MQKESQTFAMATGQPGPISDRAPQIAVADLIIAATVLSVGDASGPVSLVSPDARPTSDLLRVAEVAIVRTLAGAHEGGTIRVHFLMGKTPSRPRAELIADQTVLLCLRSNGETYVPVNPIGNAIQTLIEIDPPAAGSSRTQAVAHELEQIILTADPNTRANLIVQASLARVELRADLDHHLLGTPALQNPLRRAAWVAIALAEGKAEVLDDVPALFADAEPPADVLLNLIEQKVSQLREPTARGQLSALLRGPRVKLARAAAVALRQLHDRAVMPDLMEALDNADQETRYQAVMGLAELEPSVEGGPSYELYRLDEARYIRLWKQWWESSGPANMCDRADNEGMSN